LSDDIFGSDRRASQVVALDASPSQGDFYTRIIVYAPRFSKSLGAGKRRCAPSMLPVTPNGKRYEGDWLLAWGGIGHAICRPPNSLPCLGS
jgi:hypothetical protein